MFVPSLMKNGKGEVTETMRQTLDRKADVTADVTAACLVMYETLTAAVAASRWPERQLALSRPTQ